MGKDIHRKAYMIDQIAALDLPAREIVRGLYGAALDVAGKPLCLAAAEKTITASRKGDKVFLITGFPIAPENLPETDGPLGAAVLAEVLREVGLKPVMVTDIGCLKVLEATSPNTPTASFPMDLERSHLEAEQLLSKHNPSVLIAIERPGWNFKHEYHNMRGLNISNSVAKTDVLFEFAHRTGVTTIAVGDGGNELGCGRIIETVRRHVPYGNRCRCPCGGGIAAATPADVLVVGGLSNWAAYGIAACLGLMEGVKYQHNREHELQLLNAIVRAGAIDSITLKCEPLVDGMPSIIDGFIVDLIRLVANA